MFVADDGLVYQVTTTGISANISVVRADGTTYLTSFGSATFAFAVSTAGTYYLRVRHSSASGTASYTIAIQE